MKKEERVVEILDRWVRGEIKSDQADRELKVAGVDKYGKIKQSKKEGE